MGKYKNGKNIINAIEKREEKTKPESKPIGLEAIENALGAEVDSNLIIKKLQEKGIAFELNEKAKKRLGKYKNGKNIINAIEKAVGFNTNETEKNLEKK